jgi:hypothetical protein
VDSYAPPRFDAVGALMPDLATSKDPNRQREHASFLSIWQQMDLSDLPGFPIWDGRVFEQLSGNWPTLLSIFLYYSRGYGGQPTGLSGSMTPWGFLQWADDSKVLTKIFSDVRVQVHAAVDGSLADRWLTVDWPLADRCWTADCLTECLMARTL